MCGVTLFEITDDQIVAGRLHLEEVGRDVAGIEQAVEGLSGRRPRPAQQYEGGAQPGQSSIEWLSAPARSPSPAA